MIGRFSRYNLSSIMRVLDSSNSLVIREHLDIRPTITKTSYADNRYIVPEKTASWANLGWRFLGSSALWWVIADFSGVVDPIEDLDPQPSLRAFGQLTVNVGAGTVTQITLDRIRGLRKGMLLQVENLDPNALDSFRTSITAINETTKVVSVVPTVAPAVPAALSRVSEVVKNYAQLTVPSVTRTYLEVLNYENPMNTFPE